MTESASEIPLILFFGFCDYGSWITVRTEYRPHPAGSDRERSTRSQALPVPGADGSGAWCKLGAREKGVKQSVISTPP
jgi:hypothetical protein